MDHRGVDFILLLFFMVASCGAQKPSKFIHGVPVYNYDKAKDSNDLFGTSSSGAKKTEWVVVMKDQSDDMQVHSLCMDGKDACTAEGHPSEGDMPYTIIDSTETDIADLVGKHANEIEFIEPALKVTLPPMESAGGIVGDEQEISSFGSDRPQHLGPNGWPPTLNLMETDSEQGGFYLCGQGTGAATCWGPYSQNGADNAFSGKLQQYRTLVITTAEKYHPMRCQGNCHQNAQIELALDCKTGRKSGAACAGQEGGGGGSPPRRRAPPRRRSGLPTPPRRRTGGGGGGGEGAGTATNRWALDRIDQKTRPGDGQFTLPGGLDGKGVNVYVTDTGIRLDHTDFGGRAVAQVETHTGKRVICDGSNPACATDQYGHGSHCAGTVGGKVSGVAKGATIHSVKVLAGKTGVTSRILLGMSWIIKNHTKPAVISMSLGSTGASKAMEISIKKAWKAGILTIVAGGNDRGQACAQTPAVVPLALTVGATSKSDSRASYSNYGPCTDIWAPGDDIYSCSHRSTTGWQRMQGTSMATPHVAGAAALILQKYPLVGPAKLTETLLSSATENALTNLGTGSPNLMLYIEDYIVDGYQPPTTRTTTRVSDVTGRRRSPKRRRSSRRRTAKRRRSSRRRSPKRRRR